MTATACSPTQIAELGNALFQAFETGVAIDPLSSTVPGLTVADAYAVQRALLEGHAQAGRRIVGRKIGLTSRPMQTQLGIDSPDFGALIDSHVFDSGATVSRSGLAMIAPRVEAELGFVLSRPLRGPGVTATEVLAATASIVPVFELIDSRIRDWKITLPDTVADNASCLGGVIGAAVPLADVGPLPEVAVAFGRDDEVPARGTADAVMGDPAAAVAWLANALGAFGEALPAGEPILSGAVTAAIDAVPGVYAADFGDRLGTVTVTVVV